MNLSQRFLHFIKSENLFHKNDHLLIAVSGGVDSVVLCHLCYINGFKFSIAHSNFKLRDKESDDDAGFVRKLSQKYRVEYFEKEFDTAAYTKESRHSVQAAARELRYEWFRSIKDPLTGDAFHCILTAHHTDDNVETVLMNFLKGTGVSGLKGILPKHGKIIRPLLFAGKEEIRIFAKENELSHREDSSNSSIKYTRNYLRNELIPGIQKVYPEVVKNISDTVERFRDINDLYNHTIQSYLKKLIVSSANSIQLPVLKLLKTPGYKTILYELIKQYGFSAGQLNDVLRLLQSGSGKYIRSEGYQILRDRKWLIISPLIPQPENFIIIEDSDKVADFTDGKISIEIKGPPFTIDTNPFTAMIDASQINYPLLLRRWKHGDYFYPLGMKKKKKVSRFLIDQKISMNEKEHTWIIESNKKIIWIVGMRIDDRFKITAATTSVIKLSFNARINSGS